MKKIICVLLTLISTSVFAHPDDSDFLTNIGVGTKLEVLEDINVKPNNKTVPLGMSRETDDDRICVLYLKSAAESDRILTNGSVLTITKATVEYTETVLPSKKILRSNPRSILLVNNANISKIECYVVSYSGLDGQLTSIGDFKVITKQLFQVILADPARI